MSDTEKTNQVQDDVFASFEEKSNRLIWIIPSVILHIIVGIIWIVTDDGKTQQERPKRELTIRSDQAEMLQEHVTDANLEELHLEVAELQKIKEQMLKIREQKLQEWQKYEKEYKAKLPEELHIQFTKLATSQNKLVNLISNSANQIKLIPALENSLSKHLDVKDYSNAAKTAAELDTIYNSLKAISTEISAEHDHLVQLNSQATLLVKWIDDEKVVNQWDSLISKTKEADNLQRKLHWYFTNVVKKKYNCVKKIASQGKNYADFLISLKQKEVDYNIDMTQKTNEIKNKISAKEKGIQEIQKTLTESRNKERILKTELSKLKKAEKSIRQKHQNLIKAETRKISKLKNKERHAKNELKNLNRSLTKYTQPFKPDRNDTNKQRNWASMLKKLEESDDISKFAPTVTTTLTTYQQLIKETTDFAAIAQKEAIQ